MVNAFEQGNDLLVLWNKKNTNSNNMLIQYVSKLSSDVTFQLTLVPWFVELRLIYQRSPIKCNGHCSCRRNRCEHLGQCTLANSESNTIRILFMYIQKKLTEYFFLSNCNTYAVNKKMSLWIFPVIFKYFNSYSKTYLYYNKHKKLAQSFSESTITNDQNL